MKKLAIILGLLMFAQASFAGGTMLYMDGADGTDGIYGTNQPLPALEDQSTQQEFDPNSIYYTENGVYGAGNLSATKRYETKTTKKFRLGTWKNDPNVYWNFGAVNFGSGFTTTSGGDKKY